MRQQASEGQAVEISTRRAWGVRDLLVPIPLGKAPPPCPERVAAGKAALMELARRRQAVWLAGRGRSAPGAAAGRGLVSPAVG